jgi:hypothetical protein
MRLHVKQITGVLRDKEEALARVSREVDALRIVALLLRDEPSEKAAQLIGEQSMPFRETS